MVYEIKNSCPVHEENADSKCCASTAVPFALRFSSDILKKSSQAAQDLHTRGNLLSECHILPCNIFGASFCFQALPVKGQGEVSQAKFPTESFYL